MGRTIHAIFEGGVLKPLEDPGLSEHQRVVLDLRPAPQDAARSSLDRWREVYRGLSDQEIAEVEAIALDRGRFTSREPRRRNLTPFSIPTPCRRS